HGTGKAEVAVYTPGTGSNLSQWRILGPNNVVQTLSFGTSKDLPVPGDYDGIGRTVVAVFRPRTAQWFIGGHSQAIQFGGPNDIPAPGDYDGVGHTQIAVYRPSTGQLFISGHAQPIKIAGAGSTDIPVNAPYAYRSLSGRTASSTVKAASLNLGI